MSAAKRVKDRPLAWNASRFVRLETGSSSEAEFARCEQAYACGRGDMRSCAAVANTIGVSRTTVASRLSTAVTSAATANTSASRRRGRPCARVASSAPIASNNPARRQCSAITSSAARNATVGASSHAASPAASSPIAPAAISSAAPAPAATGSGSHAGRTTAAPSATASAARERIRASASGTGAELQHGPRRGASQPAATRGASSHARTVAWCGFHAAHTLRAQDSAATT